MAVLIAPDVVRYTLNGSINGASTATILDMVVLATPFPVERDEACETVAEHIVNVWVEEVLPLQVVNWTLDSISYIDLDSDDGPVGELGSSDTYTLPLPGGKLGESLPAQVAVLVTKVGASARGTRNGRMYVPGLEEPATSGNFLTQLVHEDWVEAFSNVTERLTETGEGLDLTYFPTVVHTRNAGTPANPDIVYVSNSQIQNFLPQRQVATQRRRNKRT